ncbi:putative RNA-directed DNA polymerase, eukaryota, reverse transcriptase zinc-binding domain protein [Tanacetum coccineum]
MNVLNSSGVEFTGPTIPEFFVSHYEQFLGSSMQCEDLDITDLFLNRVTDASNDFMVHDISNDEIKAAMFEIGDDRIPGLDGYTSCFFKKGWDIVGGDVCNAVRDFFSNGQILKEINLTFLALIPKVSTPLRVNDYRPISCCNVIYKCVSKILSNRIIDGIKDVVSENQSAFVPGRRILDNILITQELMHNYHRVRGLPRCAFKLDIQRDITSEGFNIYNTVADIVENGAWLWPSTWLQKAAALFMVPASHLDVNCMDSAIWGDRDGNMNNFSVKRAWEAIHIRGSSITWNQVWNNIRHLAKMEQVQLVLHDIVNYLQPIANNRMASSIIGRLIFASSSYYIWLELNSRIFKKVKKSMDEIKDIIMVTDHLKLLTFKFKNTAKSLNEDILKIDDSDNQYAVSIKEDTADPFIGFGVLQLAVNTRVFTQQINMAYSLLLNMAYRSSGTESEP